MVIADGCVMPNIPSFTHALAGNTKNLKIAFLSLAAFVVACIVAIIVAKIFWNDFTHVVYSARKRSNVVVGWPAFINGWAWWFAIGTLLILPFLYFMQDWKNPALAMTATELFVNQQMMRNTLIPFANIKAIEKSAAGYALRFVDAAQVIQQQIFLFKPFVKSNLERNNFFISSSHTAGDVDAFMQELQTRLAA